jgi:hypothetical protein
MAGPAKGVGPCCRPWRPKRVEWCKTDLKRPVAKEHQTKRRRIAGSGSRLEGGAAKSSCPCFFVLWPLGAVDPRTSRVLRARSAPAGFHVRFLVVQASRSSRLSLQPYPSFRFLPHQGCSLKAQQTHHNQLDASRLKDLFQLSKGSSL